jgi:dihydrofolate reductase
LGADRISEEQRRRFLTRAAPYSASDGGELAKSLFEAGLIDEIGFNIHPILLGSGIPLFHPMDQQIDLELLQCKPFKNGCVLVTYRVKH